MITTANTPNTATDHPPPCGRRGVALIIVLGLLGLLLISAVSFAVLMRTERNAATNYRHTSSARQMLHAGLARAIEDMNADIGEDLCPAWTNRTFISGSDTNPYPENIFFSRYDSAGTGNDPVPARLLTKDVMTYIPVLYHRRLTENIYAPPEWIPINYSNSVIGRYAYAVIDTSGLLDANLVFTSTSNRWLGTSPGEIRLDPAILSRKDLINANTFQTDRDAAVRYETVSELASLNGGIDTSKLANFEVFSRYSTGAVAGVTNFNLFGLTTTQLAEPPVRTAIIQAFTDSGCTGAPPLVVAGSSWTRPNILYAALADYLDSDSVMSSQFNRPITEKLPMLTCFGVAMTYTNSTTDFTNYTHTITYKPIINFAGWPVTDSTATGFPLSFRGALCFINQAPAGSLAAKMSPSGSASSIFVANNRSIPSTLNSVETPLLALSSISVSSMTNSPTIPLPKFDIYVCTEVYNTNGTRCTYFPANIPLTNQFAFSLPAPTDPTNNVGKWARFRVSLDGALTNSSPTIWASGRTVTCWAECVDPRFAYSAAPAAKQWRSYSTNTPTFTWPLSDITGVTNLLSSKRYERATATTPPYVATTPLYVSLLTNATLAKAAGLSSNQMDGCYDIAGAGSGIQYDDRTAQLKMHVANAPLKTAGELGYLLCGPWETVRLYDHFPFDASSNDYHRVLDSFEMRDPSVVPVGKVNLNNAPVDVLALLYLGMPLRSEKAANYISIPPGWNTAGTDPARPLTVTVLTPALPAPLATNLYNGLRANGPVRGLSALANVYSAGSTSAQLIKDYLFAIGAPPFGSYPNVGEFEREAVIRNIAGLLTVKQQMFTIILRADAFTTRFGSDQLKDGTVLSSAIAIAQVYREATPPHKITMRLLKILE
jgi:Tfp pilus assembly protein PilX